MGINSFLVNSGKKHDSLFAPPAFLVIFIIKIVTASF